MTNYTPRKQNETKNANKKLIVLELSEPKRFKDLEKKLPMSHTTLSKLCHELSSEKEIEKAIRDGNPVYQLTKKGKKTFDDFCNLANDVHIIMNGNGKHFRDYSNLWNSIISKALPWGIESDLTLDKRLNESELLGNKDVEDIERLLYEKLFVNIQKKKLNEKQIGNIVLGFKINYMDLIRSIKDNSLTYMKNISKEETKLLEKMKNNGRNVTSTEYKKWKAIRKDNLNKIKKSKRTKIQ